MSLLRLRPAVAVLVTVAAGGLAVLVGTPPASAAPCPGSAGVTVVVEYGALGGGSSLGCAAEGGGKSADRLLEDTGHALTWVQRFPGFVCRIDGLPADDPCVTTPPADAYWGLWWSDGKTGEWSYSSLGAASLTVPAGGYVAMVWDGSAGDVRPQADPTPHPTATPTPTPTKKPSPTHAPTPTATATSTPAATTTPTTAAATAEASTPTAGSSRTKKPKPTKTATATDSAVTDPATGTPSESPTEQQTEAGGPVDGPVDPTASGDDGGLPVWVAPVLVVVLLGAAGGVAVSRRRQQP